MGWVGIQLFLELSEAQSWTPGWSHGPALHRIPDSHDPLEWDLVVLRPWPFELRLINLWKDQPGSPGSGS